MKFQKFNNAIKNALTLAAEAGTHTLHLRTGHNQYNFQLLIL